MSDSGRQWGEKRCAACRRDGVWDVGRLCPTCAMPRTVELEEAIRRHRDYKGDERCHQDDAELYSVLPEGDTRPAKDTAVTLFNCAKYIECRQDGRYYVSPQKRIEELEGAIRELIRKRMVNRYGCVEFYVEEFDKLNAVLEHKEA